MQLDVAYAGSLCSPWLPE